MLNLNFDALVEHFHALLAEIQPFKLKRTFLEEAKNGIESGINN